ncbi:hypothetical protein AVEN_166287-1 [Araneus ventricosus]|uniref:Uncharacterized protein n=1 Tax=Araneus ventricosus TaxID=182803 RepID=A0A4Y2VHQ8_ARAVE|nr:hypothetical protein AVEN_166287-1 [Araneus ventricosus]
MEHKVAFNSERQKRVKSKRVEHEQAISISPELPECDISRTMYRTWRTCGLASSLTGPQPTGLFLLGAHEIFSVREACGLG